METVICIENYNTTTTTLFRVRCGHRVTWACRQWHTHTSVPLHYLILVDQSYAELTKSSRHKGGGSGIASSSCRCTLAGASARVCRNCIAACSRCPKDSPDKGAKEPLGTCPQPLYLRDFTTSRAEAAQPAVYAACWRKMLAAGHAAGECRARMVG
jgi:hypothetical protein